MSREVMTCNAKSTSRTAIIHAELAWIGSPDADLTVEIVITADTELVEHQAVGIVRLLNPNRIIKELEVEHL